MWWMKLLFLFNLNEHISPESSQLMYAYFKLCTEQIFIILYRES